MLEKILEEIEEALKKMYLEVANNYDISDLHYDGDKVACVASRCRKVAIQLIREIFRKHMNDGWIPVEKCLPDWEGGIKNKLWITMSNGNVVEGFYDSEGFKFKNGMKINIPSIAWKRKRSPKPYRPEKGEEE